MATYSIKKVTEIAYLASRDDTAAVFCLTRSDESDSLWSLTFHKEGQASRGLFVTEDRSRMDLVNRLQAGRYEDYLVTHFVANGKPYDVRNRESLRNLKTGREGFAPLDVVHWWEKGFGEDYYIKCDLHLSDKVSFESFAGTLMEALDSLKIQVEFYLDS